MQWNEWGGPEFRRFLSMELQEFKGDANRLELAEAAQ